MGSPAVIQRLTGGRIPLYVKAPYTLFLAVLVPYYSVHYGPLNFLWFCDVALFLTLAAVWLERPLLASMPAIAIVLPQLLWIADFFLRLFTGMHIPGELTAYMFDDRRSLFVRGVSSFHGWLPLSLVWLVWRLGYDRRAVLAQTLLCWAILLLCFFLVHENVPTGAGNVNKIFGWADNATAPPIDPLLWLGLLMLGYPLCVYVPSHLLCWWLAPARKDVPQVG